MTNKEWFKEAVLSNKKDFGEKDFGKSDKEICKKIS